MGVRRQFKPGQGYGRLATRFANLTRTQSGSLALSGVCAVYFLVAMKVLLPAFNGVGFFRASGGYWFSTSRQTS